MFFSKYNLVAILCVLVLFFETSLKSASLSIPSSLCTNTDSIVHPKETYLEIKGFLTFKRKKLNHLDALIYENGKVIQQINTRGDTLVRMKFYSNKYYSFVIKKEGFVPAIIIVSTITNAGDLTKVYHFDFEYEMIPLINHLNKDYIDFPAALIHYEKPDDKFEISETYNTYIRKCLGYTTIK